MLIHKFLLTLPQLTKIYILYIPLGKGSQKLGCVSTGIGTRTGYNPVPGIRSSVGKRVLGTFPIWRPDRYPPYAFGIPYSRVWSRKTWEPDFYRDRSAHQVPCRSSEQAARNP